MKYYSYNDYETDPSIDPIVRTLSEDELERANLYGVKECAAAIRARGET